MSQQKKKPYGFDIFKSYFAWASERDIVPSLSEFVQLNTDFVARSSTQTSDLSGLEGAWAKRFDLTAKILNTKESISQSISPCRAFASGYHPDCE
ncbi:hypothetical protein Glove_363g45 [Diversispora epigaea]|uniref:Uncharacterized protein n=1 Tax=Diversispora epigaea TaxID=1348612 RepID=A0A397HD65_9GLOM|nr:hypothetical protein Glove_363g45 [Diversispora epigaea]